MAYVHFINCLVSDSGWLSVIAGCILLLEMKRLNLNFTFNCPICVYLADVFDIMRLI